MISSLKWIMAVLDLFLRFPPLTSPCLILSRLVIFPHDSSSFFQSFSQGSYSPLHPSLQEISPLLSHFFSESLFGDGVWTIFKLWLESNAAFAQHRFSCCYSASLSAITLLSERGSTTPMIFSASSVSESGKERRIPTENLKSLFLVRKKILLAHFQSLCLLSRFSQDMEPTTSPATIIKITSTILDSFPLPLAPSSMGGSGTGGICVYGDFEMGMKILHLLLNFVNSLPKVNLSHQDSDQGFLFSLFFLFCFHFFKI